MFAPVGPGGPLPAAAAAGDGTVWMWPADADEPEAAAEPAAPTRPVEDVPWDELMRRHGRRVVVALVSRGIPLERAKELAQDAWMRVIDRHRAGLAMGILKHVPGDEDVPVEAGCGKELTERMDHERRWLAASCDVDPTRIQKEIVA